MSFDFSISNKSPLREIQNLKSKPQPLSPIKFRMKGSPIKIAQIGTVPQYVQEHKGLLGSGAAKSVRLMTVLRGTLGKNSQKTGFKDVAVSRQLGNKTDQNDELCVLEKLASDENAKNHIAKVYSVVMHGTQMVITTKVIYGKDARHCLPHLSMDDRLRSLIGYAKGLQYLHSKNVIHNDTALRNMLIDWPVEKMTVFAALNRRLARPIFDHEGKTLIDSKERITPEIQKQLESLNISQVKVFSLDPPKGKITDFDRCIFLEGRKPKVLLGFAIDCTAPERMVAYNQCISKKGIDAVNQFHQASTVKSDAFSFGQLLCDAILRPGLNTNLNEAGEYNNLCKIRMEKRVKEYEANSEKSAIEPMDYQELCKIDSELAEIASRLMNYQPDMRLSVDEAIIALEKVLGKFPFRHVSKDLYDNVFKAHDEAKKLASLKSTFGMFANFSKESIIMPDQVGYT